MTTKRRRPTVRAQRAQDVYRLLLEHYGERMWEKRAEPMDELIYTVLSQHTSDLNTDRTFADLQATFPTWREVVDAPTEAIQEAIKRGGLSKIKAPRIQAILREIERQRGEFSIDFLADIPFDEARRWLLTLPGVGEDRRMCPPIQPRPPGAARRYARPPRLRPTRPHHKEDERGQGAPRPRIPDRRITGLPIPR